MASASGVEFPTGREGDERARGGWNAAMYSCIPTYLYFVSLLLPDRKSTRLNSSHSGESRMPSSA